MLNYDTPTDVKKHLRGKPITPLFELKNNVGMLWLHTERAETCRGWPIERVESWSGTVNNHPNAATTV